jgi:MoaA/NifB/PqqE/SkfB family radical SAM enzyme
MIRIVNWILTRKCNLSCDYCAIVKDYHGMPKEYPPMKHYLKNEMSVTSILNALAKFKQHNPNCFHIFYGGEPMLKKGLVEIIQFCHRHNMYYTIISNNTEEVQPLVKKLIHQVGNLKGYTASIDPIIVDKELSGKLTDRMKKSKQGFEFLLWMKDYCDDVVAEITVMREDQHLLHKLVKTLSDYGINSDITFIDIAKSEYYDFSNITSTSNLVEQSPDLADQILKMINDDDLDIHMKRNLLPAIFDILPSNMDCKIEKSLHNVTIDADGSVRLCLRIRGTETPSLVNMKDLLDSSGQINGVAHKLIARDKEKYCELCNHTCLLMSKIIDDGNLEPFDLVHLDRRIPNG